jgi:ribonuclease BN (tRNA processing enzyme)
VRLIVLGAGPAYTDRVGASGASYLVSDGDTHILLDLGQGSFTRIFPHVHPTALAAVVVSHLHPDHFIDLVPMRHFLRFEFEPSRRMRVLAPAGLSDRIDALHAEPGFSAAALDTEPLGEQPIQIGSLAIQARLVSHTEESYAVRVSLAHSGPARVPGPDRGPAGPARLDRGPGLVYSGDCGRADDIAPLILRGDTLLSEVSFGPGPVLPGVLHLDGPAVGRLAAATGAGRVLLTHLQMGYDADATVASVRAVFGGSVQFVWPGSVLEL